MLKNLLIFLIEIYQKYLSFDRGILMSFAPGGACKFEVSCSEYTKRAIAEKGAFRGMVSGIKRILICR